MIIAYKLRRIGRNRIDHPSCTDIRTVPIIFGALGIEPAAHLITCVALSAWSKYPLAVQRLNIVHSRCDGNLDARVVSGSVDGKTTPAAYTEDPDTFRIHTVFVGEKIDRCAEIFRIDVGRSTLRGTPPLSPVNDGSKAW